MENTYRATERKKDLISSVAHSGSTIQTEDRKKVRRLPKEMLREI